MHIDHLSVLLKEWDQSLPLIVMLKLDRILEEFNYFFNCNDIPGVCGRWIKLDPKLEYFDVAYDMFGDSEERLLFEENRQRFRVFVTENRFAKRNEYFSDIKKKYEAARTEFSKSKAYRDELLRVLKIAFELDFAGLFPNLEFTDKPCDDEPEFINMNILSISPERHEVIDKILRQTEEDLKNGKLHAVSFEEFKEHIEHKRKEFVMKCFDEAKEKFVSMSLEEFKSYCPTDDLIDPRTGTKAFDDSMTTLERYERFRKLAREIGYDADASYDAMVIAQLVFPFASREEGWYIAEQDGIIKTKNGKEININPYGLKYELRSERFDFSLRGDTMNSVATTLKACSHLINGNAELEQLRDKFITRYHTFGNFMLLPYRNGVSVNSTRGKGKSKDYFDLFLSAVTNGTTEDILNDNAARLLHEYIVWNYSDGDIKMKDYFDFIDTLIYRTPEILGDEAAQLLHEYVVYHFSDKDIMMKDFIHFNLLENSIDDKCCYKLWEGHDLDHIYPEMPEQVKAFFINAAKMIEMRSEHIYKCMKGELH